MMPKKAQEGGPMWIIIVAVIALIVLGVVIFIFRDQIVKVAKSFTGISQEATCKSEIAMSELGGIFGGRCEPGADVCKSGCLYACNPDGSLTLKQECEKGCANAKSCT